MLSGHWWTFLRQAESIHGTGPASGVRDISFDGAAAAQSGVPGGANGAIIELVQVFGVRIQRCAIYNCQNNAIAINQGTEAVGPVPGDVKVLDNTIDVMAIAASEGSPATGGLAIIVTAFNNVIIRNNVIGYNPNLVKYPHWNPLWGGDGIDVLEASDVTISGNQITLVQNGITCDWGIDCVLTDNIVENFLGYGIQTERLSTEEATSAVSNLVIAGNAVVAAIGTSTTLSIAGIVASAGLNGADSTPTASHWAVGNNIVKGPFSVCGIVCAASDGTCTGNSIDLNTFSTAVQTGMLVQGSSLAVTGNQIFDDSVYTLDHGLSGIGLEFYSDPNNASQTISYVVVDGNAISQAKYAVQINSTLSNVAITSNNLTGNITAIQFVSSALSGCRIAGNLGFTPPSVAPLTLNKNGPATKNTWPYDCTVSVANGSISGVVINGQTIAWPGGTTAGPIVVQVPVNGMIQVNGSGSITWTWTSQ
jgi:hypothetical protein